MSNEQNIVDVVSYISKTQSILEKNAASKQKFDQRLSEKIASLRREGKLTEKEASQILTECKKDPSAILSYLDVPSYTQKIASLSGPSQHRTRKMDPIERFVLS